MSDEPETIFEAAIREPGGQVWQVGRPGRHHNVMRLMPSDTAITGEQGFITNKARFVGRVEGLTIAAAAGQIIEKTGNPDKLYSEDVW